MIKVSVKISKKALAEIRRQKSLRSWKYSVGGQLKTRDVVPITLRRPKPEKSAPKPGKKKP